jgi:hypothetical protein
MSNEVRLSEKRQTCGTTGGHLQDAWEDYRRPHIGFIPHVSRAAPCPRNEIVEYCYK